MILSDEQIKAGNWSLRYDDRLENSHLAANARIRELEKILHSFLRAPSVGSDGPGSSTIVVQEYHIRAARTALKAKKCLADQ